MQVIHAGRLDWGASLTSHRAGRMTHKILFEGTKGSPDNYLFVLANEGSDYYSPRHRHAWDQVRFCLEGSIPIGRDLRIDAGEIGYFPEGVHYGPQEGGPDRVVLLLQIGGASGLGYLSPEQIDEGRRQLQKEGVFADGVFRRDVTEGRRNEDAYEAIWRTVTGKPLSYPKPRYKAPIVLRPEGFPWRETGAPGVRRKALGTFPDRGLSLELIGIDRGSAYAVPTGPTGNVQRSQSCRLLFIVTGTGRCDEEPFEAHTAFRLDPGEAACFTADDDTQLLGIDVPLLEPRQP